MMTGNASERDGQQTPYQLDNRLEDWLQTMPPMEATPAFLGQTFSWSTEENRGVTLAEVITAHFPAIAKACDITSAHSDYPIKRVCDLTDEELKKVTCAQLSNVDRNISLATNGKDYPVADLPRYIEEGTYVGDRMLEMTKRNIFFIERMAEMGKICPASNDNLDTPIKLPPFRV